MTITEHDRHVLALAVHVEADSILTFNLRDFPTTMCEPYGIDAVTDIEGHTEMMQRLGDEKGREILREHERITRSALVL